jgi:hypothetical protein
VKQKVFVLANEKSSASAQRQATHMNLSVLQLLWKMQLYVQCEPINLRPHWYVFNKPAGCHAQCPGGCRMSSSHHDREFGYALWAIADNLIMCYGQLAEPRLRNENVPVVGYCVEFVYA